MEVVLDFVYLCGASIGVVGLLEFLKGFIPGAPATLWRLLMPVVCLLVAYLGGGGALQVGSNAVLLVALCQLGYDKIIASGKAKVG